MRRCYRRSYLDPENRLPAFDPAHLDGQPATSELCLSRGDAFPHLEDQQGGGICYDALLKRKREQEQNRAYLRSLQGPPAHSEPDRFVYNRSGEVMIERGDQIRTPARFRAGRRLEIVCELVGVSARTQRDPGWVHARNLLTATA